MANDQQIIFVRTIFDVTRQSLNLVKYAKDLGFGVTEANNIGIVVSELASNIVKYAVYGKITVNTLYKGSIIGIEMIFSDDGDGILNVEDAMKEGFSTGGTLGMGLPASYRMSNEFDIESSDQGTTIRSVVWTK